MQRGIEWIVRYQRYDDRSAHAPRGWPYDGWEMCWGKHSCHSGVVKTLKALAELPAKSRSEAVQSKIAEAVEFLLKHHVFKKSHDLDAVSVPSWTQFGFPRLWETDVLEIVDILMSLGVIDRRLDEAIALVKSKQCADGRWLLEGTWNGRTQAAIEQKGMPSKWVTLHALRALRRWSGMAG
jgi:hypothetical protein